MNLSDSKSRDQRSVITPWLFLNIGCRLRLSWRNYDDDDKKVHATHCIRGYEHARCQIASGLLFPGSETHQTTDNRQVKRDAILYQGPPCFARLALGWRHVRHVLFLYGCKNRLFASLTYFFFCFLVEPTLTTREGREHSCGTIRYEKKKEEKNEEQSLYPANYHREQPPANNQQTRTD